MQKPRSDGRSGSTKKIIIPRHMGQCRVVCTDHTVYRRVPLGVVRLVRLGWCRVGGLLAAMRGEEGPIAGATAWLYITAQLLC